MSNSSVRFSLTFWLLLFALLAAGFYLVVPKTAGFGASGQARVIAALGDLKVGVKSALDQYKVDVGNYPKSLQDLVQQPSGTTSWHGPYLDRLPVDPWGNPYVYDYPGRHNPGGYDLLSAGPDGLVGTKDDVVAWTK